MWAGLRPAQSVCVGRATPAQSVWGGLRPPKVCGAGYARPSCCRHVVDGHVDDGGRVAGAVALAGRPVGRGGTGGAGGARRAWRGGAGRGGAGLRLAFAHLDGGVSDRVFSYGFVGFCVAKAPPYVFLKMCSLSETSRNFPKFWRCEHVALKFWTT